MDGERQDDVRGTRRVAGSGRGAAGLVAQDVGRYDHPAQGDLRGDVNRVVGRTVHEQECDRPEENDHRGGRSSTSLHRREHGRPRYAGRSTSRPPTGVVVDPRDGSPTSPRASLCSQVEGGPAARWARFLRRSYLCPRSTAHRATCRRPGDALPPLPPDGVLRRVVPGPQRAHRRRSDRGVHAGSHPRPGTGPRSRPTPLRGRCRRPPGAGAEDLGFSRADGSGTTTWSDDRPSTARVGCRPSGTRRPRGARP